MTRFPLRIAIVTVIVPFAVAVVGVALQLAWLPELPETIATHWDLGGEPDAFGPAWSMPLFLGVLGILFPAVFGTTLARTVRAEGPTATQKLLAVASLFAVTLLSIVVTASIAIQRGLAVGASSPTILPTLGFALVIALVLAVGAWLFLPRAVSGASARTATPPVPVAPGELVAWVGHARFSTWVIILLCVVVALATAVVVFVVALRGIWPLLVIPFVLALSVLGTSSWRVRIDRDGLRVRPTLGWPLYRITLADVESAATTTVVPLGEFGGYGLRWGLGRRMGIVTRGGEALEVQRRDGRALVVTVDDAATAAGLLTALAARTAKR